MSKTRVTLLLILMKKNKRRMFISKIEKLENAVINTKSALDWKTVN